MKRIKQEIIGSADRVSSRLQKFCNNLSPQKRMITTLFLCFAFAVISLYMTAISFYSIWRSDQQADQIQRVNKESGSHHSEVTTDSIINPLKQLEYE